MGLSVSDIRKIADLAYMKMDDSEYEELEREINSILEMIAEMQQVDTSNIKPVSHPTGETQGLRKDQATATDCTKLVMANAPLEQENLFLVPKVID